ncbi:ABC transporter permease [Solirubrobacter ginsenosidimutans]|uniref:ABC transporter permease n=1 Tax=Solirubrobacter ginsenosidimutans TaxID=490573 RepID=A0A9X3S2D2_9ACTN|nr:ABC transporter permease [Solirubrobacter ginsenosidimutans]MDA0162167.1 ABC transporter permease [Solirubrobacter ginsenosidimutans]
MSAVETVRTALGAIAANKLRAGLTMLGLCIGVAAVIALVAVGNGSKQQVESSIDALGSNVLVVQAQRGGFGPGASDASVSLTTQDATALADTFNAPDVKSASPVVQASSATLVSGSTSYAPSSFVGTTPSYATAKNIDVASGAMFTSADVKDHARKVVIGPTVAENLFSGTSPIGQSIRVDGTSFTVIGVTASKGSDGTSDQDDVVLAPLTAVQDTMSGYGSLSSITVQARTAGSLDAAQAEVESILDERKHVTDTSNPGFSVINQGSVREASSASTDVFTTLLGAVAAISLLVGGIGVMNIMLVSVTERTREIGIRKAIGARRADVMQQFLVEAILVSVIGGALGVAVGLAASHFEIAGVQPAVAASTVALAFGAAVLCGLFFGTYPAARAARLRPVQALRFE